VKVPPNQTDAPNPGMTPQFHARREWPGVGDPCRWVSRLNTTAIMIHRICALIMVVVPLLFLCAGCGTVAGAQRARGTGTRRTYEAPPDKVWNAIPAALTQLGLSVASNNRADGCILATGAFPAGAGVRRLLCLSMRSRHRGHRSRWSPRGLLPRTLRRGTGKTRC